MLVNRQDMRTNSNFRQFLELDTQVPESITKQAVKISEINDLNLGGRDFIFGGELKKGESKAQILFVAMSDMNIASRLDAYLTNVRFLCISLNER